jgi:predicted kinase
MSTLYLPIGPPGSGKSTLATKLVTLGILDRDAIVSPDDYRRLLTDSRASQHENKHVFEICHRILEVRLRNTLDVWFDATNLSPSTALRNAHLLGAETICVLFRVSEKELRQRNKHRDDPVPEDVLERFIEQSEAVQVDSLPGKVVSAESLVSTLTRP